MGPLALLAMYGVSLELLYDALSRFHYASTLRCAQRSSVNTPKLIVPAGTDYRERDWRANPADSATTRNSALESVQAQRAARDSSFLSSSHCEQSQTGQSSQPQPSTAEGTASALAMREPDHVATCCVTSGASRAACTPSPSDDGTSGRHRLRLTSDLWTRRHRSRPPQIWARKPWRHVVQIIICACELYGA
jgi:hypothetical protein